MAVVTDMGVLSLELVTAALLLSPVEPVEGRLGKNTTAELTFSNSAVLGPSWRLKSGVAEEARTRGFATPAFAGCALVGANKREARYAAEPRRSIIR
jgi:hypothetical protein